MSTPLICPRCQMDLTDMTAILKPEIAQMLHAQAHRNEDHEILRVVVQSFLAPFVDAMRNDEPINGSDVVDLLGDFYRAVDALHILEED